MQRRDDACSPYPFLIEKCFTKRSTFHYEFCISFGRKLRALISLSIHEAEIMLMGIVCVLRGWSFCRAVCPCWRILQQTLIHSTRTWIEIYATAVLCFYTDLGSMPWIKLHQMFGCLFLTSSGWFQHRNWAGRLINKRRRVHWHASWLVAMFFWFKRLLYNYVTHNNYKQPKMKRIKKSTENEIIIIHLHTFHCSTARYILTAFHFP